MSERPPQECPGNDSWWRYHGYIVVECVDRPQPFTIYGYSRSIFAAVWKRDQKRREGLRVEVVESWQDEAGAWHARYLTGL